MIDVTSLRRIGEALRSAGEWWTEAESQAVQVSKLWEEPLQDLPDDLDAEVADGPDEKP